jgi:hypothetical protein
MMASAANWLALGLPSECLLQEATSIRGKGGRRRVLRGSGIGLETDATSQIDGRCRGPYPSLSPRQERDRHTVLAPRWALIAVTAFAGLLSANDQAVPRADGLSQS